MKIFKPLIIFIFMLVIINLFIVPASANYTLEERLELIEASRRLQEEQITVDAFSNQIGVVFTNFGSDSYLLNPGVRFDIHLAAPGGRQFKLITEGLYLREPEDFAGFISLAFHPVNRVYFGAGGEITGLANYQAFVGIDITDNIFLELKGINTGGSFEDSDIYFSTGFKISF